MLRRGRPSAMRAASVHGNIRKCIMRLRHVTGPVHTALVSKKSKSQLIPRLALYKYADVSVTGPRPDCGELEDSLPVWKWYEQRASIQLSLFSR